VWSKFNFNKRRHIPKDDYDLNVVFRNGKNGCAETKCKYENTILGENTILYSRRDARKQLPDDRPGVVFVKVPENWLRDENFRTHINAAVKKFLRGTKTVVAVELFATDFAGNGTVPEHIVRGVEVMNEHHQFDTNIDWSLIGTLSPGPHSAPPWWRHVEALIDPRIDPRSLSGSHANLAHMRSQTAPVYRTDRNHSLEASLRRLSRSRAAPISGHRFMIRIPRAEVGCPLRRVLRHGNAGLAVRHSVGVPFCGSIIVCRRACLRDMLQIRALRPIKIASLCSQ
jgi:hypothetical protein